MAKPKLSPGQASTLQAGIKAAAKAAGFTLADMAYKVPDAYGLPERDDRWIYNNIGAKNMPVATAVELYRRASAMNEVFRDIGPRVNRRSEHNWRRIQRALDDARPAAVSAAGRSPEVAIFPGSSAALSQQLASRIIAGRCASEKRRPEIEALLVKDLMQYEDIFSTRIGQKIIRAIDSTLPLKLVRGGYRPFYGYARGLDEHISKMRRLESRRADNNRRRAEVQNKLKPIRAELRKLYDEAGQLEARRDALLAQSKN